MARLLWAALLGAGVVAEARSLRRRDGATLSETTRLVFRTDTRGGRLVFVAFWGGLSAWFVPHIIRAVVAIDEAHERKATP